MSDYKELVQALRDWTKDPVGGFLHADAADAIEALMAERDKWNLLSGVKSLSNKLEATEAKLQRCVEVLRFYANKNAHQPSIEFCEGVAVGYGSSAIFEDGGQRASETLAAVADKEGE